MRRVQIALLALLLGALLSPRPARAASYRLGLGADYWFAQSGLFDFTLTASTHFTRHLSIGGRFGAAIVTSPSTGAIPLDLVLRGEFSRYYLEGLAGPWILFQGTALRGHVAGGFGIQTRDLSVGVEIGYLDPNAVIGLRVGLVL